MIRDDLVKWAQAIMAPRSATTLEAMSRVVLFPAKPEEVLTKSAPASSASLQAVTFWESSR